MLPTFYFIMAKSQSCYVYHIYWKIKLIVLAKLSVYVRRTVMNDTSISIIYLRELSILNTI